MQSVDWIVVADTSRMRIFAREGTGRLIRAVDEIDFPAGREKLATLSDDEANEAKARFAKAVAEHVNVCFREGRFSFLILVLHPDVFSSVKDGLADDVATRVKREEERDLASLPMKKLLDELLLLIAA